VARSHFCLSLAFHPKRETHTDSLPRTYPSYLPSHPPEHSGSTAPSTPNFQAPMTLDSFLQVNPGPSSNLSSGIPHSSPSQPPIRQQYASYTHIPTSSPPQVPQPGPPLRFIDSNPRPTKSPRHVPPPEIPSNTQYSDYGTRFAAPYNSNPSANMNSGNGGGNELLPPRDSTYFPTSMPMNTWSAGQETAGVYTIPAPGESGGLRTQHYQFPADGYGGGRDFREVREEGGNGNGNGNGGQGNYTWNNS